MIIWSEDDLLLLKLICVEDFKLDLESGKPVCLNDIGLIERLIEEGYTPEAIEQMLNDRKDDIDNLKKKIHLS